MRITKWGEYGVLFSLYLAKVGYGNSVGAAELAQFHAIPIQYAQQILQRLRRGSIVKSIRGPGGGYTLAARAEEINLRMVLSAAEGDTFDVICDNTPLAVDICSNRSGCAVHNLWEHLKKCIDDVLEQHSLAMLLRTHQSKFPSKNGNSTQPNHN